MKDIKHVSIAIPIYNNEHQLKHVVANFVSLNIPEGIALDHVIFIDDGSTDKSFSYLLSQKTTLEHAFARKGISAHIHIVSYPVSCGREHALSFVSQFTDEDVVVLDIENSPLVAPFLTA